MRIYCTGCKIEVEARLTNGEEMYPHREDLETMQFYVCDTCRAFVGTHRESGRPLGFLATPEIKYWRKAIHAAIDPLWRSGKMGRKKIYTYISRRVGYTYHTGEIFSVEEGKKIFAIAKELSEKVVPPKKHTSPWDR